MKKDQNQRDERAELSALIADVVDESGFKDGHVERVIALNELFAAANVNVRLVVENNALKLTFGEVHFVLRQVEEAGNWRLESADGTGCDLSSLDEIDNALKKLIFYNYVMQGVGHGLDGSGIKVSEARDDVWKNVEANNLMLDDVKSREAADKMIMETVNALKKSL